MQYLCSCDASSGESTYYETVFSKLNEHVHANVLASVLRSKDMLRGNE